MTRYSLKLLVFISAIILAIFGCNSSPTASNSDLLYAKTSKNAYSINDTITLNINNNTEDSVYFKYYDDMLVLSYEVKISNNNWIPAYLFFIPSGAVLNTRVLEPDSIKQYKKRADWAGMSRFRIPYNDDGSTDFPDTLISNIFTVE